MALDTAVLREHMKSLTDAEMRDFAMGLRNTVFALCDEVDRLRDLRKLLSDELELSEAERDAAKAALDQVRAEHPAVDHLPTITEMADEGERRWQECQFCGTWYGLVCHHSRAQRARGGVVDQ